MQIGVVVFPGSNCDHDAWYAFNHNLNVKAEFLWHDETSLAYGDYLRCGAIARFSPVMGAIKKFAAEGGPVFGICNGFQILVESGLLPGALIRNQSLKFVCREVTLRTETTDSPFTCGLQKGQTLRVPVARYLEQERQAVREEMDWLAEEYSPFRAA